MDNFYSSPSLFDKLEQSGIGACGTVNPNRIGMPTKLKKAELVLKKGDDPVFMRKNNLVACAWHDTKRVSLLSTVHTDNTVEKQIRGRVGVDGFRLIEKSVIAEDYNNKMAGVDRLDQLVGSYKYPHKSSKWYNPLYHRIREVAFVNGYILYKQDNPDNPLTPVHFRRAVIDGLLEGFEPSTTKSLQVNNENGPNRLTERHFICAVENKKNKPHCAVCSDRKVRRKQTSYKCKQCDLPMCIEPCFERYHTLKKL
ncbi:hypothetical protein SNE40_014155 [Patella caerulea]|uniref:PiggyBac transposable element-derived protein domain-containing protein n=1 Tax=Patella caerulea TaxID=87958 RepID=A0AAN8JDY7_PATCE